MLISPTKATFDAGTSDVARRAANGTPPPIGEHVATWAEAGWTPPWFHWMGMEHHIAWWIILLCHAVIALGTLLGGWRVVRTMGHGITRLQPIGGFCAETSGAAVVIGSSLMGIPVSTTHCITGSILGVGTTRGLRAVRWIAGQRIILAWIFTLPCSAFMAAVAYMIVHLLIEPWMVGG